LGIKSAGDTEDWNCRISIVQVIQRTGTVRYEQCKWYRGLELFVSTVGDTDNWNFWISTVGDTDNWNYCMDINSSG
jgi:hypothetical protein